MKRRHFLFGLTAALVAIPNARILRIAPALAATSPARTSYQFTVLQDPRSTVPVAKQLIDVEVQLIGPVNFPQIEQGAPMTREADHISAQSGDYTLSNYPALTNYRTSPTWRVDERTGILHQFAPGTTRVIPGEGMLCEERRTNHLPYSSAVQAWSFQTVRLAPDEYSLSWYGPGWIRLVSEAVALIRRN